jgi:putative heme transporter
MIRGRLRRHHTGAGSGEPGGSETHYIEIEPGQLSRVFSVPGWLRDIGLMSWLLVGVTLLLGGLVWLLALTQVISIPVIVAAIIATVGSPIVAWLHSHHVPRAAGAALLMLGIVAVGALMAYAVVVGIDGQASSISGHLSAAKDTIGGWLQDLGLDAGKADSAKDQLGKGANNSASALIGGLLEGIGKLSSLAFFLAMTILSLFFLLKDGPEIRAWAETHMGVPAPVAKVVTQRTIGSMRGYFLGVTIVAAFSAAVVGIGTLILGVPLLGTIVAVTFIAGYVPYIGAWSAAIFSVLLALGSSGTDAAIGMIVVQFLANGALQQLVQPFAMGAALGIHPLAVLIVTIAGGALFGTVGLIVAAPLVSAVVRISADLARVKAAEQAEEAAAADAAQAEGGSPAPAPG